jgi:hypothetical protein
MNSVMRHLHHWLKKHNINPDDVRLVLEFDRHGDWHHADMAIMHDIPPIVVSDYKHRPGTDPKLYGIRYKMTAGEYRR